MTNKEKIYIIATFIKSNTTLITDKTLYEKYLRHPEYFSVVLYKENDEIKAKIEEPEYEAKENELLYEVYLGSNLVNNSQVCETIFSELGFQLSELVLEEYYK